MKILSVFIVCLLALGTIRTETKGTENGMTLAKVESVNGESNSERPHLRQRRWGGYYGGFGRPWGMGWHRPYMMGWRRPFMMGGWGMPYGGFGGYPFWGYPFWGR